MDNHINFGFLHLHFQRDLQHLFDKDMQENLIYLLIHYIYNLHFQYKKK